MKYDGVILQNGALHDLVIPKRPSHDSVRSGQLAVGDNLDLVVNLGNEWQAVSSLADVLYLFTEHVFTTGSSTRHFRPTRSSLIEAYGHSPMTTLDGMFDVANGIQKWVVPADGEYEIEVLGSGTSHGRGARVLGRTILGKMDTISILCGQYGADQSGGCGGTFVESATKGLLAVAGGAGGCSTAYSSNALGVLNTTPVQAAVGWINNGAYAIYARSSGGGGYSLDAATTTSGRPNIFIPAASFKNGGHGGVSYASAGSSVTSVVGNFGGGGAGAHRTGVGTVHGGGGGYIGGRGSSGNTPAVGGSSYIDPESFTSINVGLRPDLDFLGGEVRIKLVRILV